MFSPQKFFKAIKGSLLSIKELKAESMSVVEKLIKEANAAGQIAYSEHLQKEKKRIAKELTLIGSGFYSIYPLPTLINLTNTQTKR